MRLPKRTLWKYGESWAAVYPFGISFGETDGTEEVVAAFVIVVVAGDTCVGGTYGDPPEGVVVTAWNTGKCGKSEPMSEWLP